MHAMNEAPTPRASRVKDGYTTGARTLASRSVRRLARTRVTPNALTAAGVTLCLTAAAVVPFESRDKLLFYWLGAVVFVVGSILDILDGALARVGGKSTAFGAFFDSTTDRVGEGAMLAAIGLVFARAGNDVAVVFTIVAVAGSFLVPYVRAITAGLVFAPWGGLQWAIYLLAATAWLTVLQRILHVRKQLVDGGTNVRS
jgi:hypothetical protein